MHQGMIPNIFNEDLSVLLLNSDWSEDLGLLSYVSLTVPFWKEGKKLWIFYCILGG